MHTAQDIEKLLRVTEPLNVLDMVKDTMHWRHGCKELQAAYQLRDTAQGGGGGHQGGAQMEGGAGAHIEKGHMGAVYPGNTPENHPPTEACMINSKQHRGCRIQDPGPVATGADLCLATGGGGAGGPSGAASGPGSPPTHPPSPPLLRGGGLCCNNPLVTQKPCVLAQKNFCPSVTMWFLNKCVAQLAVTLAVDHCTVKSV